MRTVVTIFVGALLGTFVAGAAPATADTFVVNSTADAVDATPGNGTCATAGGVCTLRAAVQEANAHAGPDIISLPAGLYGLSLFGTSEDLAATGDLDVTDALEVNGAAQATTIIDGLHVDRIFQVTAQFTLRDVTLRGGSEATGGALLMTLPGTKTLERVLLTNNTASMGGAIAHASGDLVLTDTNLVRNTAGGDGGGLIMAGAGSLTIAGSTFTSNTAAAGNGGAVRGVITGSLAVTNTTVTDNVSGGNGAGLYVSSCSTASVSGSTFDGNVAIAAAGGLTLESIPGSVTIADTTMTGNYAAMYAGGYVSSAAAVQMTGGEVSDNTAPNGIGGMFLVGATSATVDGTIFRRNGGGIGPIGGLYAVASGGPVVVTNVEASENAAIQAAGMLAASPTGSVTISRTRVFNNGTATYAGGVMVQAATGVAVTDSTISDNTAVQGAGGLYATAGAGVSIENTTVSGNSANGAMGIAGGLYVIAGAAASLSNSTISGNTAVVQAGGMLSNGNFTLRNMTFVDNDAPMGSAIYNVAGTVTAISTIIAGAAPSHCAGTALTSGGNNIDSTGTCGLAGPGDQIVDPQLGPLADNGGPTLTHLPASTSPALDAGAATGCPATDQRGETRPTDGNGDGTPACDVGAVEFLDLCPADPAKVLPGICGCGVADTDANFANGTADCLINGELKARIARAKTIIGSLAGDADPLEAELGTIGTSLPTYVSQFKAQLQLTDPNAKIDKLAKKASKKLKKVGKVKAGKKLDKAKAKANTALDALDAAVAPQA